jgi:uncharacterized protein YjbI with pentapeptide repeats
LGRIEEKHYRRPGELLIFKRLCVPKDSALYFSSLVHNTQSVPNSSEVGGLLCCLHFTSHKIVSSTANILTSSLQLATPFRNLTSVVSILQWWNLMANSEHLVILKRGVQFWNSWRSEDPNTLPDFSGAELSQISLRGAFLAGANLEGASLVSADLGKAIIWGANLQKANLQSANLEEADLFEANLKSVNLLRAKMQKADLTKANLQEAVLAMADLGLARLWQANLKEADLYKANLDKANLYGANLEGADLLETNFSSAILLETKLKGALNLSLRQISQAMTLHKSELEEALMGSLQADYPNLLDRPKSGE